MALRKLDWTRYNWRALFTAISNLELGILPALSVGTAELAASAVTSAKALMSVSAETTGTGAEQSVAHGLAVIPSKVLVVPTELAAGLAGGHDCAEGTHTTTNVVLTVTSGAKFKVLAWA